VLVGAVYRFRHALGFSKLFVLERIITFAVERLAQLKTTTKLTEHKSAPNGGSILLYCDIEMSNYG
jgi:hypothetical protein